MLSFLLLFHSKHILIMVGETYKKSNIIANYNLVRCGMLSTVQIFGGCNLTAKAAQNVFAVNQAVQSLSR